MPQAPLEESVREKVASVVAEMSDAEVYQSLLLSRDYLDDLLLSAPHPAQQKVIDGSERFNVLCAGRRFGKSRFGINRCIEPAVTAGLPVGWFAPTYKNLADMWREIVRTFQPITRIKSETEKRLELDSGGVIEMWSLEAPDAARGRRYARIIVDECAMVRDLLDVWYNVLRPMLIDYEGDAYFLSTPKGKNDFQKMYDFGQSEKHGEWASWRFPSSDNPYLPESEIADMRSTMPAKAFEQEILARFIDEVSGALWKLGNIDQLRVADIPEAGLARVVVAIDPAGTAKAHSDETGIIGAGIGFDDHGYVLADSSGTYSPLEWASKAISQYDSLDADRVVGEVNYGGDLIQSNLRAVRSTVSFKEVHSSRGKALRAEPVAAMYEQGRIHHVGFFPDLETQMTTWSPFDDKWSPDRVDALVFAFTELMLKKPRRVSLSYQG